MYNLRVPIRQWFPKRPDISTETMMALRLQNWSLESIAKHVGMSAAGVHMRLKKAAEPAKYKRTWKDICSRRMLAQARKRCRLNPLIPFNIDIEDISVPDRCPVFGTPFVFDAGKRNDNSPSLDRIIPARGYVKGNVWVISWRANRTKCNLSIEEIVKLARAVEGYATTGVGLTPSSVMRPLYEIQDGGPPVAFICWLANEDGVPCRHVTPTEIGMRHHQHQVHKFTAQLELNGVVPLSYDGDVKTL